MNSIIQTMMHIPMLRDYFLSDQHSCRHQSDVDENNQCLMCEISHIFQVILFWLILFVFQEFYSGEKQPYIPSKMLHLVWTHAKQLAGYEQKDAHEFFISALNVLHKHSDSLSMKVNPNECRCIIDRLFTGQLQSDLTCGKCGYGPSCYIVSISSALKRKQCYKILEIYQQQSTRTGTSR